MLRIAVCDDMSDELKHISALTNEYIAERGISAEIREFSHPDTLMTVCETVNFHIFMLDIVMPMISGLELGRSLRRISTDAQIIYITTEPSFALEAYAVNPLQYLIKPVSRAALFDALDLAAKKTRYGEEFLTTIKTQDGLITVSSDEVAYCEYAGHSVIYTLAGGRRIKTLTVYGRFAEHIEPLMRDSRFIQPHISYAVNMSFVERLDKDGFTLRGGDFIPVPRKHFADVRKAYVNYRLGEV